MKKRKILLKFSKVLVYIIILYVNIYSVKNAMCEIIFSDDFESGNLSKWTYVTGNTSITSNPTYKGKGALSIYYNIPAGGTAHQDCNRFVQVDMKSYNLNHFFVKGYVYLASTPAPTIQRKLYYIFSYPHYSTSGGDPSQQWDVILSCWGETEPKLAIGSNYYSWSDLKIPVYNIATLKYDKWYCLELEVKLNTPPDIKDGLVRVFVDRKLVCERKDIIIRNSSRPLGVVRVGNQIDRNDLNEHYEYRYWDDVSIGTSYMGCDSNSLDNIIVFPNPFEAGVGKSLKISKLTSSSSIRIYSIDGKLVKSFTSNDITNTVDGYTIFWDGRDNNELVSRGVYIIEISDNDRNRKLKKVVVVK